MGPVALASSAVPTTPPPETPIRALNGREYSLSEWVMLFNLLVTAIDPYTHESSWILKTAARIMRHYDEADVRVGFLITCDADDARRFLGPFADEFLVVLDPERSLIRACELERLPALLHFRQDASLAGAAEGWDPATWTATLALLEQDLMWRSQPQLPQPGDPAPYTGSPALS